MEQEHKQKSLLRERDVQISRLKKTNDELSNDLGLAQQAGSAQE
tara:strand:- start:129 stop:260 length:132 start_codon:yes stop_codon:yes gene_type:complete